MSNSQAGWRMARKRPNAPGLPACDARNAVEKGNERRTQRSGERSNEVGRSTAETDRAGPHRLCRSTKAGSLAWLSIDTPLLKAGEGFFGQALLALDSPRFASALCGARIAAEPQSVVLPTATSLPSFRLCRILLTSCAKIASLFFRLLRKAGDVRQLRKDFFQRLRLFRPQDDGVNDVRGGGWNTLPALDRWRPGVVDGDG